MGTLAKQVWRFYYFAGSQRIAMRYKDSSGTNAYTFFLSDHLGSTTLTVLPNGVQAGRVLYKAFGEQRHSSGTTPTDYRYTGQLSQMTDTGLYYYGARWYDPALGRFTQADSIVPSVGGEDNLNSVGYVPSQNYSPLIVDYHELQFLEQNNQENQARLWNPGIRFASVPINSLAFDRYAYSLNSPILYNDSSGHCPWCVVVGVVMIAGAPVEITVGMVTLVAVAAITAIDVLTPGFEGRVEARVEAVNHLVKQAGDGFATLFAKKPDVKYGDYLADKYGLTREQRRVLHDTITRQGLTKEEIEAEAAELARQNEDKKNDK